MVAPNKKVVLYSDSNLNLNLLDVATKKSSPSGVKTLSEKCTWVKSVLVFYCAVPKSFVARAYPDDWYQGLVSFDDVFWKIDVASGTTSVLFDPKELAGVDIDGVELSVSPNEDMLFFINKKDRTLWSYSLQ